MSLFKTHLVLTHPFLPFVYTAGLAGLTYDVKVLPRGVRLTFGGFNDKLQKFAAYVAEKISKNVKDIIPRNDDEFERYKDQVLRALSAFDVKQPYAHASYYANLNLQPPRFQYTNAQLREETSKAGLSDLKSYATTVWSSGKGQALVQGNVDEKETNLLVNTIDKTLGFKPIPDDQVPDQLTPLCLPLATNVPKDAGMPSLLRRTRLVVAEPNPVNGNAASFVLIQSLGEDAKDHVMIELLSSIVEQPFYDDLRTRQQLGYIVSNGVKAVGKTRTIAFIVQSSVAPVEKLTTETLKFLDGIQDRLNKLPSVDFGTYVKGLIDRKTEPDKQLATEVMRNWAEISSGRLEFDRIQKETLALLELEKSDLIDFWNRIYVQDAQSRVLITQVVPREGPASSPEPPKSTGYATMEDKRNLVLGIDDIEDFRRDLEEKRFA
jgi:insulysin